MIDESPDNADHRRLLIGQKACLDGESMPSNKDRLSLRHILGRISLFVTHIVDSLEIM